MTDRKIEKIILNNGITLLFDQDTSFKSATHSLTLLGGILDEKAEQNGLTHFLEHLLFKSNQHKTTVEIANLIDCLGGEINAFTEVELLELHGIVPASKLEDLLYLTADLVLNAKFNERDINLEREVIRQEILAAADDPDEVLMNHFYQYFYAGSNFAQPIAGSLESITNVTVAHLQKRLAELLVGKRMIFSFAGQLDIDKTARLVERLFSGIQPGQEMIFDTPKIQTGQKVVPRTFEQSYFVLAQAWVNATEPDYLTGNIFSILFGESVSSRLFQNIREQAGLVYDITSSVETYNKNSHFLILSTTEKKNLDLVLAKVKTELENLNQTKFTLKELAQAQALISAQFEMFDDLLENRLWRLTNCELIHKKYIPVEEVLAKINSLTLSDLENFINRRLTSSPRLLLKM
ncbi:MAG: insulinase family protein [Deltaproteobacteria bacterium]|jgi:predicted Zn-dependent peptidase|nr:insulinase family protein [Deltaproteobacteria bacterium]